MQHFTDALKIGDVRLFVGATGFFTLASRALTVVIGFQIYRITRSPLALGGLGLIEAIPVLSLVVFGGYVADTFNRRSILLITRWTSFLCALALVFLSAQNRVHSLIGLYTVVFLAGIARGFSDPANTALEAQIVPRPLTVNAASWITSTWIGCSVLGSAAIGFVFDARGAAFSYLIIATSFLAAWTCTRAIAGPPQPKPPQREAMFESITLGWRFVFGNQPLLAAMALDLLAVLFGGAVILLPIYADDILHVGAKGLGLLNASASLGALVTTLLATRHPPIGRAGRSLLWVVAGFGANMLLFAFSKLFWLSSAALFLSGACDGVSVVIRRSMVRLLSPDALRGRVAAASWVFICASNELGAFESGLLASWIGVVPSVAAGGMITLVVAALTAVLAPQLRKLSFDVGTLEQKQ